MDLKNIQICYCRNKESQSSPMPISLYDWITTDKFKQQVEAVRAIQDKTKRDDLKSQLPCAMPCLLFNKSHSGFIAVDVDGINHNENLNYTPAQLKQKISSIANVAYCGYSASGLGVWALIPLFDPIRHLEHFRALQEVFKHIDITIDESCSNINRLRFASYDNEPYINENAKPFSLILVEKKQPKAILKNNRFKNTDNVFENFNLNGDAIGLLQNHGWKVKYQKGDRIYLQRPGKDGKGISGNFNTTLRLFTTWSSSTVFESRKAYNASQLFHTIINSTNWTNTANELKILNY
ncbi:MAG: BT4734/BF3469 family protein [Paludibacter sp.]